MKDSARTRPSRAMMVAFVAVSALVALAGHSSGPVAGASSTLNQKVKKLTKQVKLLQQRVAVLEGEQGAPRPPSGPAGGDLSGSYPNPSIADGAVTAADIGPNAVGPGEIQDINRVVHLPLTSFVNSNDVAVLDTVPSDGTSPDLTIPGNHLQIAWDDDTDGGGGNIADTDSVLTGFAVPPDYAFGGHFLVVVAKDGDTGVEERFSCTVRRAAFLGGGITTSSASVPNLQTPRTWYHVIPGITYSPGDSVAVSCWADDGAGGTTADNIVYLEQIQFLYNATQ